MSSPAPRFYFDYVDPASFLLERRLSALEAETGGLVARVPFELAPPPSPLLDPAGALWRDRWSEARAAAPELDLATPRLIPWTRKAHELAEQAREQSLFDPVHRALFEAFQLQGRDLGRVDVLLEIAVRFGMDLSHTKAVLDVDRHTETVETARADAERLGVAGVPALLSGGRRLDGLHDRGTLLAFLRDS
jgi:predicted DsbA family dithiol-disulfide isomerase